LIEIDGSYGEGGGQIIRSALALSALTGKAFKIFNIRAKRDSGGGLKAQHLTCVKALAQICNAKIQGDNLGSKEIIFEPKVIKEGEYQFDVGTAGSIPLVIQALLPAAIFSQKKFKFIITGGTHAKNSPPIEYTENIFIYTLNKFGANIEFNLKNYGFFQIGRGKVIITINPSELKTINIIDRGSLKFIKAISVATLDLKKAKVAERQIDGFKAVFGESFQKDIKYVESLSTGTSIHTFAEFDNIRLGTEALGERNKKAEEVGRECAIKLKEELQSKATVDSHMLDQILIYLAFTQGRIKFDQMTEHALTNLWLIEKFLPIKFETQGDLLICKPL